MVLTRSAQGCTNHDLDRGVGVCDWVGMEGDYSVPDEGPEFTSFMQLLEGGVIVSPGFRGQLKSP